MLLACWALVAEPEDLLVPFQPDFFGKVPLLCILTVVPLSQQDRVFCNGGVLDPAGGSCTFGALRAAAFHSDTGVNTGTLFIATGMIVPAIMLVALCHHSVRSPIICSIVPLSCQ